MKFFCTLLKIIIPKNKIIIVKEAEIEKFIKLNSPVPYKHFLNPSIIKESGFKLRKNFILGVNIDIGYTTGVAYINNCIPKPRSSDKSLYFVVRPESIIPIPIDFNANNTIKKGKRSNIQLI